MPLTLTEEEIKDKLHLPSLHLVGKLKKALDKAGITNEDLVRIEGEIGGEWHEGAISCAKLGNDKIFQRVCEIKEAIDKADEYMDEHDVKTEKDYERERLNSINKVVRRKLGGPDTTVLGNIAAFTGKAYGGRKRKSRKSKKRSRKTRRR
jgi:hypothetical protein